MVKAAVSAKYASDLHKFCTCVLSVDQVSEMGIGQSQCKAGLQEFPTKEIYKM